MKRALSILLATLTLLSLCMPAAYALDINQDEGKFYIDVPVQADAYMLVDLDTDEVIAQKNKDKVKYPASLTKIVTTMVSLNNIKDLQETAIVSQHAIDAVSGRDAQVAGLKAGDSVNYEQLLYLTMVYSACDACQVLAESIGGSEEAFADMMNEWVKSIGCKNTHFTNPDGLHDDEHYTTAADMKLITLAAIENPTFLKICSTTSYTYGDTTFTHTNFMLDKSQSLYYYAYAQGIKTGSTSQAGYCVITMAQKDDHRYLVVVMDSPMQSVNGEEAKGSFIDAKAIFEWAFAMKSAVLADTAQAVQSIAVIDGKGADSVALVPAKEVSALVPQNADLTQLEVKALKLPASLKAPVKEGDTVCKAVITYRGKTIAETELVAQNDVKLNVFARIFRVLGEFIKAHPILFILILLLLAFIVFVIIQSVRKKKARKRKEAMRKKRAARERQRAQRDYYDI